MHFKIGSKHGRDEVQEFIYYTDMPTFLKSNRVEFNVVGINRSGGDGMLEEWEVAAGKIRVLLQVCGYDVDRDSGLTLIQACSKVQ